MARDAMRTVARLRALREEQARQELAEATAALQRARLVHEQALTTLRAPRTVAAGVDGLRQGRVVDLRLREEAERAAGEVAVATRAHAVATEQWRQRRADQRAVERLLARRREEARAAAAVAEQAALDELAIVVGRREAVR